MTIDDKPIAYNHVAWKHTRVKPIDIRITDEDLIAYKYSTKADYAKS